PFALQIVVWKPRTSPAELTRVYRRLAKTVIRMGGVVRQVENHGERRAPYRFRSRTMSADLVRYHASARWVSAYYDADSSVKDELDRQLKVEENMLRMTTLRPQTKMDKVASHMKYNPWVSFQP
ncbi:unnamed protein product, partial [Phaeothamnion confervicola]